MQRPYLLLLFILYLSGCSSLPTQTPSQDSQIASKTKPFTWVGVLAGEIKNKWPSLDGEVVVTALKVYPVSPAMKAGFKKDDIIISINGETVKSPSDFADRIKEFPPSQEIRVAVLREGDRIELKTIVKTYDVESYVSEVREYVKKVRSDDLAYLILGDYFFRNENFKKALEHYEMAANINPKNSTAYARLADIYGFKLKKYEEGIEYFKKAISISPEISNYHFDLGLYYSILKQHENAASEYQNSIKIYPNDSEAYNFLGDEYLELKKYRQAMEAFENSVRISPNQFKARLDLGKIKRLLLDDEGAIKEFEKLLQLSAEKIKINKLQEAELLVELGNTYYSVEKYDKSFPILEDALVIRKQREKEEPHLYLYVLRSLGNAYYAAKHYGKAFPVYKEGESISKGLYGESSLGHALDLGYFGHVNYALRKWGEAESLYLEAIKIYKSKDNTTSYEYLDLLNNLGSCRYALSDYIGAESIYKSVVEISTKSNQKNKIINVFGLSGVARSLFAQYKYVEAEKFYLKALALLKKIDGEDYYYASMLGTLGSLYYGIGAQNKAEDVLLKSERIFEEKGDDYSFGSKNYLGLIYFERLEFDRAMKYFQSARDVVNKLYGVVDQHPDTADILYNISRVYFARGKYDQAFKFGEKASQAIPENDKNYLDTSARIKMGMAEIYRMKRQFDISKALFTESLNILELISKKDTIVMASNLIGAARLDADLGDYRGAWKKMQRAVSITEKDIKLKYEYTADHEKLAYFRTLDSDFYVSLVMALAEDREIVGEAYGLFLRMKNNVLFSSIDQNRSINIESKDLKDTITRKRQELARLSYSQSSNNNSERIQSEIDELERKLSRNSSSESQDNIPVDLSAISKNMPQNSILMDFLKASLNRFDGEKVTPPGHFISDNEKERLNPHHYFAMVYSKNDDRLRFLDLGLAREIDKSIIRFRGGIQALKSSKTIKALGNKLYKSIFNPASKMIGSNTNIFISPDSNLALLPFETLVDNNGNYLVDKYKFTYLNSGRDFMGFNAASNNSGLIALFGNPDFDYNAGEYQGELCQDEDKSPNRCPESNEFFFSSLAGTEREVNQIKEALVIENVKTYKSQFANEAALKEIESPKILHIATHGFFLKNIDMEDGGHETRGMVTVSDDSESLDSGKKINNPLLASGIALSGANRVHRGVGKNNEGEDGIVSAMEIMGLNLQGTSLVVLSACNTGVGDVERGQGIFGLRRAFQMAGARSLLMSLWKVPDSETVDLMRRFYLNLYSGKSKVDSLNMSIKDTMREIKNIRGTDHPFYWGGFILIGNPENN